MPQNAAPTLLVFTLGATRESARRRLLPAGLQGMEVGLRQACFDAALAAGRACGCRLAVCSPERGRLPEGVEGACAAARRRRRGPLVVVGTDVPGLADRHLREALTLLDGDPRRVVLGPSPDGGVYLLAAAAPLPPLADVRWCRPSTLADLARVLAAAGREVVLLEPLADLDRPADLDRFLSGRRRRRPARAASPAPARREAAPEPAPAPEPSGPAQPYADLLRRALAERRRPPEPPPAEPPASPDAPRVTGRAPPFSRLH
jgi:hypothetical protein